MTRPVAFAVLLLLTLAASVAGTPGEPQPAVPQGASYQPMTLVCAVPSVCQSNRQGNGVGVRSSGLASMPAPSGAVGTVIYSAVATWCAPTPRYCTGWGGNARLAAVNSFRFGDEPYPVRVWRGDMYVDATVVSFCACRGTLHAIDLSPAAWTVLEPDLGAGRIDVVVEVLVDLPPDPADERMRVEDRGLPAKERESR